MIRFLLDKLEESPRRKLVKKIAVRIFSVAHLVLRGIPGGNRCFVCNARLVVLARSVMDKKLIEDSRLNPQWVEFFDQREGEICISCGASLRVRQLALAFVYWINERKGLRESTALSIVQFSATKSLRIAEINSCGALHKILSVLPDLKYSEYQPDRPDISHEDIQNLTYTDGEFDLVLHSDTLEHVPDIDRALNEIYRVLKPGGATIFTVPVVRDGRKTIVRAALKSNGEINHLLPPSFHGGSYQKTCQYLVFYEFGEDFLSLLGNAGFRITLLEHPANPAAVVITATKSL